MQLTDGSRDIMLFASNGKAVRFAEDEVRSMGRTATGVRGMRAGQGRSVRQTMIVVDGDGDILTASETRLRQAHRRSETTRARAAAPRA